jgi:hypothetical protein
MGHPERSNRRINFLDQPKGWLEWGTLHTSIRGREVADELAEAGDVG